jgi:hypothetical protein
MWMLKIMCLFIIITLVNGQLAMLYTRKRNGQFVPILNKKGQITKNYRGGIYTSRNGRNFKPVHKRMENNWIDIEAQNRRRRRQDPVVIMQQ